MSKEERKLKAKVDEYFEKYMCVSFDKFIENWEDLERYSKEQDEILQQKENIIKKVREYCDREIGNIIAYFDYVDTKDLENIRKILDKGE